jgi:hypothetical protein
MDSLLLATVQEVASVGRVYICFHNGEILEWMFYGLGNSMKYFVVISWLYT